MQIFKIDTIPFDDIKVEDDKNLTINGKPFFIQLDYLQFSHNPILEMNDQNIIFLSKLTDEQLTAFTHLENVILEKSGLASDKFKRIVKIPEDKEKKPYISFRLYSKNNKFYTKFFDSKGKRIYVSPMNHKEKLNARDNVKILMKIGGIYKNEKFSVVNYYLQECQVFTAFFNETTNIQ